MIYLGIDDTDNHLSGGTGRVARTLAAGLRAEGWSVRGVTRHQLLKDPRVPYTSNNSSNVIHVLTSPAQVRSSPRDAIESFVRATLPALCLEGSDPGYAVLTAPFRNHPFGRWAQENVLSKRMALDLAAEEGIAIGELDGTGDGVVGALAGVLLAAGGSDGRFVDLGLLRFLEGDCTAQQLLDAGAQDLFGLSGERVTAGVIETQGRVRPLLRGGRAVLFLEPLSKDVWRVEQTGKSGRGPHGHSERVVDDGRSR